MTKTTEKKVMIIAESAEAARSLPAFTGKKENEIIIVCNLGAAALKPYDFIARHILLSIYTAEVEEVYIVGESVKIDSGKVIEKIRRAGVSSQTMQTLEYIGAVGPSFSAWITGQKNVGQTVSDNIKLLKSHPLVPKQMKIFGFVASHETGKLEEVHVETVA